MWREAALFQRHVVPVLQHLKDRRIGRWPPDAELLHLSHKAGFGVTGRRFGEMLIRRDGAAVQSVAFGHRRQYPVAVVALGFVVIDVGVAFVMAFLVQL